MDPNSRNQIWSEWTFVIHDAGRLVPRKEVALNAARWLRMGFGSAGAARVDRTRDGWRILLRVEGAPVGDPSYVASVRKQFAENFVAKGWGPMAWSEVSARLLAGPLDGAAPSQWVDIPPVSISEQ